MISLATLLLADIDGHMDLEGGWWILMAIGMVLFWGLIVLGIVWLVRELKGARHPGAGASEPLAVLDQRLAEGAISVDEYKDRREILSGGDQGG